MHNLLDRFTSLESKRVNYDGLKGYVWQLFGYLGESFFKKKPPNTAPKSGLKLLNLGAGSVKLEGFVNADFYRLHKLLSKSRADWMLDLSKPLNCDNDYWDGVLIEHVNEHLLYSQNYLLFKELFRTLRSKGVLRIVVPDLNHYLSWNELRLNEPKMDRYKSLPEAISNLTQNHAHVSVWNKELLQEVLEDIGFVEITETGYMNGNLQELIKDSKNHQWQSLYMEAKKP
jgi:predicted SAM-dependent methyltransferase